jgi:hypothetical protein
MSSNPHAIYNPQTRTHTADKPSDVSDVGKPNVVLVSGEI